MIFVTGGTGILGAHLLYKLTQSDTPIRAIYRSQNRIAQTKSVFKYYGSENWEDHWAKIEWIQGDILDISSLLDQIEGSKIVYHCAALVSFHRRDFTRLMKINREGTENIVNACLAKNIEKLCYVSSTAAIGGGDKTLIDETTKWKKSPTTSAYSVSKYCAEREVWRGIEEGLNAVIVNPSVIFGAGNWNESSLTIFKTALRGISYYPTGSNATVDARDVVEIMVQLVESNTNAERYLCVGSNQSFKTLMTAIANQMGTRAPSKKVSKPLATLVRRILGFIHSVLGTRSSITKETVDSLYATKIYDTTKVTKKLDFQFRPLSEQVRNAISGRIE